MRATVGSVLLLIPLVCSAEQQIRITCGTLKGTSQRYTNHLSKPYSDHFAGKPVFALGESTITLTWKESAPEPPREIPLTSRSPAVITAIDAHPGRNGAVTVYSLFPKQGLVFVAQHYLNVTGEEATQSMFSAKCEFAAGPAK
jgi:hypothetical protein